MKNLCIGIIEMLLAIFILHNGFNCQTATCQIFGESTKTLSTLLIFSAYLLLLVNCSDKTSKNVKYVFSILASIPLVIMFIPFMATGHYPEAVLLAVMIIFLAISKFLPQKSLTATAPFNKNVEHIIWLVIGMTLFIYNLTLSSVYQEAFYSLIVLTSLFTVFIFHTLNTDKVTIVNSISFPAFLYNCIAIIMIHFTGGINSPLIFSLVLILIFSTNYIKSKVFILFIIIDIFYFAIQFFNSSSANYNDRSLAFIYIILFIIIGYSLSIFSIKKT